jgi:hypothetical protein
LCQESLVFSSLSELFLVHLVNFLETIWETYTDHRRCNDKKHLKSRRIGTKLQSP